MEQKIQNQHFLLTYKINSVGDDLSNENIQNFENHILNAQEIRSKTSAILSKSNNDPKTEQDFRRTCTLYESQLSIADSSLAYAYDLYVNAYHKISSLHATEKAGAKTKLFIYDTENENEDAKTLEIPESLSTGTCIAKLPSGELFCFGKCFSESGVALIIYNNYNNFRLLSPGESCYDSSTVYFNRSIYCFGGRHRPEARKISMKYDMDKNLWIKLTPMPRVDWCCHSVIFKGNILISGLRYANILLYSIDLDSFSTISYNFSGWRRKILINVEEKLYLIECSNGYIYESEIGDEYSWKYLRDSIIEYTPDQVSWVYNKGGIYIISSLGDRYYKFDLDKQVMIKL